MQLRRHVLILLTVALAAIGGLVACEPVSSRAQAGQDAVAAARGELGQPYKYGSDSRATGGYDCSGLTSFAWKQAGVTDIPRSSRYQWTWVERISKSQLQPGDLVFYSSGGPSGTVSHVAMYAGNDTLIHARNSSLPVREDKLSTYWVNNRVGYGRVPASSLPGA